MNDRTYEFMRKLHKNKGMKMTLNLMLSGMNAPLVCRREDNVAWDIIFGEELKHYKRDPENDYYFSDVELAIKESDKEALMTFTKRFKKSFGDILSDYGAEFDGLLAEYFDFAVKKGHLHLVGTPESANYISYADYGKRFLIRFHEL